MLSVLDGRYLDALKCLVESGLRFTPKTPIEGAGLTILHHVWAVECAEYLIERNADVAAKDAMGKTPLRYAMENYRPEIAAYLRSINAPYK
jgi:ankyrin repeat protein